MPFVIAAPEMMTAAATDLATIGANVNAAHLVAASPTLAVIPAAADEVSAGIAQVFSQHAASYQALAGQAAAFNDQFVQHLTAGAGAYAGIEATLASLLQDLQNLNVNADLFVSRFAGFVSFLATLPPRQLLFVLGVLLTAPVWLPILGIFALIVGYGLYTGAINIMPFPMCMGFADINMCPIL
jgi:PE family